ncbi:hypothetical protein BU075_11015 [Mammaliicoccus vitulinus]|nr:hypothetical protein BU075_11015 [Mammaliicoccus vitulinus]
MTNQSSYKRELILQSYDFESASLPRGMVRACSLSLILFPPGVSTLQNREEYYKNLFLFIM